MTATRLAQIAAQMRELATVMRCGDMANVAGYDRIMFGVPETENNAKVLAGLADELMDMLSHIDVSVSELVEDVEVPGG